MRIELSPYDKNDILRVVEYARNKTYDDYKRGKLSAKDYRSNLDKIELAEEILNGKKKYPRVPGMKGDGMDFDL